MARVREPLLDYWRGLALIDMAWVHLAAYPIGMPAGLAVWLSEHTRFAAGAFVLLSGMTVARVFGPPLQAGGAPAARARSRLFGRAMLLLVVGRLVAVAFAAMEQARVLAPGASPVRHDLWQLALFGDAGVTGGLLLLYAFLLVLTPLLVRLARDAGPLPTLLVSFAVYAAALTAGDWAHWPRWTFPLAHWQPFFVIGYLASPYVGRLCAARAPARGVLLFTVTIAAAMVFLVRSGATLEIAPDILPFWDFTKVPLRPAEMLWYLAASALVMSWSGWAYLRFETMRSSLHWVCRLGRWSLLVYVAHLFLELPIVDFLTVTDPPPMVRATMLLVIAALMSVVATMAERFESWRPTTLLNPLALLRRGIPVAGSVGSGLAALCLGFVLLLAQFGHDRSTAHYTVAEGDVFIDPDAGPAVGELDSIGVHEVTLDDAEYALAGDHEQPRHGIDDEIVPTAPEIDISSEEAPIAQ